MKISKTIQRFFFKRKPVEHEETVGLGGLTKKHFELMGEEEKRLEEQGLSALEIEIRLGEFGKHENDIF